MNLILRAIEVWPSSAVRCGNVDYASSDAERMTEPVLSWRASLLSQVAAKLLLFLTLTTKRPTGPQVYKMIWGSK